MLPTLEIVGSAFLLDPRGALFGPGGPCCVCVSSPNCLCAYMEVDSASVVVVMANDLLSWQQKLGSLLMVLILSSLFACEESHLRRSERERERGSCSVHSILLRNVKGKCEMKIPSIV